jgi:hypothetical protein
MKKSEAFPTRFVSAPDLKGPITLTISHTTREMLKNPEGREVEKTIVYFVGAKKGLVLNQVNWDSVAEICGEDSDAWPGGKITLFPTKVPMGGKMVDAVRVRRPDDELPMKKPAPAPMPPAGTESPIPF